MLSTALTDPAVIHTLFTETGAEVLLHEPGLNLDAGCKFRAYTPADIDAKESSLLPPTVSAVAQAYDPERIAFIQYTSGSTGDMPAPVPYTNKWIKSVYDSWKSVWNPAEQGAAQDVFNIPASFNGPTTLHSATNYMDQFPK
jgi:acyl-coenzyme A synthetase/AMP-(fatty) acid ligase